MVLQRLTSITLNLMKGLVMTEKELAEKVATLVARHLPPAIAETTVDSLLDLCEEYSDAERTRAWDEGYAEGVEEGEANVPDRYQEGYDDGYDTGVDEGRAEMRDEAYESGYDDGHAAGYQEGYDEGLEDGETSL